ncbi:MAG: glycosyltransferase family 4 protein [Isosphaeraceae bacterium]|nr:glycosyltransferase family 4 protein [Isosphaeraceae bacterium]
MLSLLEHTDSARLDWRGVAVLYPEQTEPTMYRALKSRARVGFGPTALDELYRAVDVVLVWGVTAAEQRLPRPPRRCKVVLVSHGSGPWTARVFSQYARADAYAAVSRQALLPVPEAVRPDTTVIGNCFEPERVAASPGARAALRGEWGVRPGEAVLGYLGRLSNEKNPGALIAAVEADASVRGVFVGTGAMLSDLQARTSTSPAHDRIVFHGAVELPGDALSAFDAMVLPSHEEGCAIVVLEAWAAGCPVIATPVGIAPEWPELVRTIPLGPSGAAIAEALAADRADPAGTRARVERAKEVAQAQFSPAAFGAAWTELVARVNTAPPTKKTPPWLADTAYVQTSVTPSPAEVAAERDIIARVNACPYRGCRVSCTSAKCAAGKGDQGEGNVATMSHCRVCVAGS